MANAKLNGFGSIRMNAFAMGAEAARMFQVKSGRFRGGAARSFERKRHGTRRRRVRHAHRGGKDPRSTAADSRLTRDFLNRRGRFRVLRARGAARTVARFHPAILLEYDEARHGKQGTARSCTHS
jgi:hypothetical protein